jgi:glutaredoxin-like protein
MSEKLLNADIVQQLKDVFQQLQNPVEVLFFGSKQDCEYCDDTRQLTEEVVAVSDKLHMQVYDIDEHAEIARQYNVDKAPGLVLAARDSERIIDYGVRFAGIPSGHEFSSLIHDLVLVSGRDSGLTPQTRSYLADLKEPVLLQVFVTPT